MKKNDFWFFSLITFLTLALLTKWSFWLRIAVVANAIVVLIECAHTFLEGINHGN